jgi:hypothetical protein
MVKVKEFIEALQGLDQEANIWLMYDPPFACTKPKVTHLVGADEVYANMYADDGVSAGDYAIICW